MPPSQDDEKPVLQPLAGAGFPAADEALDRLSARIGYRPHALSPIARRPSALAAVLSLVEEVIFKPGASAFELRWMAAYATCVGAGCGYSGVHAAHGAVDAGVALARVVSSAYSPGDEGFNPGEQALLHMAGAVGRSGDGAMFAVTARDEVGEEILAEIVLVCAAFGLFNRWNRTMRTELEPALGTFANDLAAEITRQGGVQS